MAYFLGFNHRATCKRKQEQREQRISDLINEFPKLAKPFDKDEEAILTDPIEDLVESATDNKKEAQAILQAYAKVAIRAQKLTNCVTEVMIHEANEWIENGGINLKGSLAGLPVSLKDTLAVEGFDGTAGYSNFCDKPFLKDGPMVRLLKELGAVPYVKTNVPITLLSYESTNDVWGRCTNPHNRDYSPGGSSGGEGALLAYGGRIGIGSDVAGSVRVPAHNSGCYAVRCSIGRWPRLSGSTSMPGQDGVPAVYSPMARTMADLTYFTAAVIKGKPWRYDHTVLPLEWRDSIQDEYRKKKVLKVGVMRTDGVVDPSPACVRVMKIVEDALKKDGHELVEIEPPSSYEGLLIASRLINNDGLKTARSYMQPGEWLDSGASVMARYLDLPSFFKYLYYLWVRYVRQDLIWAGLIRDYRELTGSEIWKLFAMREAYKVQWMEWWNEMKLDFIISPPNATPALPHNAMKDACSSCGYSFLFNLLDYTAGVFPVTKVDAATDKLPSDFKFSQLNGIAQGAYKHYDATAMHGLPVGVQVIGRRLDEEKVITVMERIVNLIPEYPLMSPT